MKKTSKKIFGGILAGVLIATIGAIFATAQDDVTNEDYTLQEPLYNRPYMDGPRFFNKNLTENGFFFFDLPDEQQVELDELITSLNDQGANFSEIHTAIQQKLDEFGVLDQRLDNEIIQAEQHLQMLNKQKELREQGYSWDEIENIIQEEYGVENLIEHHNPMMMGHHHFAQVPNCNLDGIMSGEETNQ